MHLAGSDRSWSFFSTGFEPCLSYVVAVGAALGASEGSDLALDPSLDPLPQLFLPEPIVRNARPTWRSWWEAAMAEYRRAASKDDAPRGLEACEAPADAHLRLALNRVRQPVLDWLASLEPNAPHSAGALVDALEAAHGRRTRDFQLRYDLLPVAGAVVYEAYEDAATAAVRLLISSSLARSEGNLDRIFTASLERIAF